MFLLELLQVEVTRVLQHLVLLLEGHELRAIILGHFLVIALQLEAFLKLGLHGGELLGVLCSQGGPRGDILS